MKTKIPPPIIALVMIAIIYLSSLIIEPITFNYQNNYSDNRLFGLDKYDNSSRIIYGMESEFDYKIYSRAINKLRALKSVLNNYNNDLKYKRIIITKHKIEWHRKFSLSIACIILFLIGAPLGALIKKGGFGLPAVISVFFFLIYHVISMIGEKAAKDLSIEAYQGIWISNIIFIPIAFFLIFKAKNDSDLFINSSLNLSIFTRK